MSYYLRNTGIITSTGGIILLVIAVGLILGNNHSLYVISGVLLGTGTTLFITGLNGILRYEYTTTVLDTPKLDLEVFIRSNGAKLFRVSAIINNSSNILINEAKGFLYLDTSPAKLYNILAREDCGERDHPCRDHGYLVNRYHPDVKGDALAWALSEKPIERPAVVLTPRNLIDTRTDYVHITSLSPYQKNKLLIFDFLVENNVLSILCFFSEYGAPGPKDKSPRPYRICFMPNKEDRNIEINVVVSIAGEGLRKPLEFRLRISRSKLEDIAKHINEGKPEKAISELQELIIK